MGGIDDMSREQMLDRIRELSNMEQNGELDDVGRRELNTLRSKM